MLPPFPPFPPFPPTRVTFPKQLSVTLSQEIAEYPSLPFVPLFPLLKLLFHAISAPFIPAEPLPPVIVIFPDPSIVRNLILLIYRRLYLFWLLPPWCN